MLENFTPLFLVKTSLIFPRAGVGKNSKTGTRSTSIGSLRDLKIKLELVKFSGLANMPGEIW